MAIERIVVDGDSTSADADVLQDTVSNSIVVDYTAILNRLALSSENNNADYTEVLNRLAVSAESIAASMAVVATNSTAIKNSLSTISEKQTSIETYQKKLKELAEGEGVHVISPLEYVGFVTTYRRLIEEGTILKWRDTEVSDKDVSKALNDLGKYLDKIQRNIPKAF
jgi:ABC-type uncharacterized transport system fused permease/ATPase subunit